MSVLAVIYKQIEQQLYTVLTPSSTPALVWIDLYNNQDIAFKEGATNHELPITFPNALIAFGEIEWETDARNNLKQQGTAQLHIYIGQEFYQDSYLNNGAPMSQQAIKLTRFDLLEAINNVLQNFSGTNFKPLKRTNTVIDDNYNNIIYDTLVYSLLINDCSAALAKPPVVWLNPPHNLHINPDYQNTHGLSHIQTGEVDEIIQNNT
ncbi:MAG: hypothetical protein IPI59_15560 [Sphingobacteriales bacterium]|jgi:hypothetical protein|nr:hypothetical protein [Sphingobacteriales bacterium]MBP9141682.1 hypothetical protein [Chitinophagales bacterium]MDA0198478.1 hypothetical protein [Bacteroidota bacterium]MBK6888579.1 hypothetical protein [Sphingobacteriales bacterium]MBK7528913.1 hypothetical protein [Sphingobacteriales bacterium]